MTARWEPGTVAVATVRGVPDVRVTRIDFSTAMGQRLYGWIHNGPSADTARGVRIPDDEVTDVRPLVVLDFGRWFPAYIAEIPAWLRKHADDAPSGSAVAYMAQEIEAQTRPAKPPEPTGLGAVVRDRWGHQFVRSDPTNGLGLHWHNVNERQTCSWDHIDAVEVLSEGVR